ncbi:MAG: fibronectin type III domain-containing protein [Crocinitomicaceae bacterium]|nr:fibronectin type III domain-containing protein [Crocinitomicaceae bacterium]
MKQVNYYSIIIPMIAFSFCVQMMTFGQGVGINPSGADPDQSAMIDVSSTSKGALMPRMTTAQRNAIATPAEGLQIFNTTTKCFEFFANGLWQMMACACSSAPAAPTATAGTDAGTTQITANWNMVVGASFYYLDVSTVSNFSSFVPGFQDMNVGQTGSFIVTGLSCGLNYYYRVRAANACGTSSSSPVITYSTSICPPTACTWNGSLTFTMTHTVGVNGAPETKTITYGQTQSSITGSSLCWLTQNLGSTNQATSATDATEAASGWYWQFNRIQGYKHDGSTRTPNTVWITSISEGSNWQAANDPCTQLLGSGWRIPTNTEWINASNNSGWTNMNSTYASVLKLHPAGRLDEANGSLCCRGSSTSYSSSVQSSSSNTYSIYFDNNQCNPSYSYYKATGRPLRCVR